jgi:hypothetical protein
MNVTQQRKTQRLTHLVAALMVIVYVYGPHSGPFQTIVRILVVPTIAITGIAMWQAPRFRHLCKRLAQSRALDPTA